MSDALRARALALHQSGQAAAARPLYLRLLTLQPNDWQLHRLAGLAAAQCGALGDALLALQQAQALAPDPTLLHNDVAVCLAALGRKAEALAQLQVACAAHPAALEAQGNRIALLRELHGPAAALEALDALPASLHGAPALLGKLRREQGLALAALERYPQALVALRHALTLQPAEASLHAALGAVLLSLQRPEEALAALDAALQVDPRNAASLRNRASARAALHRHEEALQDLRQAHALEPDAPLQLGRLLHTALQEADWQDWDAQLAALRQALEAGAIAAPPFVVATLFDDPALLLQATRQYAIQRLPAAAAPLPPHPRGARIRLAYVSADFHDHATAHLMAGLFEQHSRARFELIAVSLGPDAADDPYRTRLRASFDHFLEGRDRSDTALAEQLRALRVDIAIDLKGYTRDGRPGLFAARAAPLQVAYLGYPGTMAAPFIDYAVVDDEVAPAGADADWSEALLRLPRAYQVNDSRRARPGAAPPRAALGLPEQGFVFACFNAVYKIQPAQFAIWMRLLKQVPDAVLWLLQPSPAAQARLQTQAQQHGVAPARLVFAARVPLAEHLARHGAADLFLDTLPCNAHTTASDALWSGLPLLTQRGRGFAGRVAASLLRTQGLHELICDDAAAYEATALALARDPARRTDLRARVLAAREQGPLFDTAAFTRCFEQALLAIYERQQAGLPPASLRLLSA